MPNTTIDNVARFSYIEGLHISPVDPLSGKKLNVFAGAARDSSNTNDIILPDDIVLDGAVSGINGIDTGAIAPDVFYAVYAVGDSTNNQQSGAIISLNPLFPLLPAEYDMYRRIGWILTNNSSDIVVFEQSGSGRDRLYTWNTPLVVLASTHQTTFTDLPLGGASPTGTKRAILNINVTTGGSNEQMQLRSFGSSNVDGQVVFAGNEGYQQAFVPVGDNAGVPTIQYRVNGGLGELAANLASFYDEL